MTNFVYDGLNPVQEKAGATVTANLLTGLGIDEFFQRTMGLAPEHYSQTRWAQPLHWGTAPGRCKLNTPMNPLTMRHRRDRPARTATNTRNGKMMDLGYITIGRGIITPDCSGLSVRIRLDLEVEM